MNGRGGVVAGLAGKRKAKNEAEMSGSDSEGETTSIAIPEKSKYPSELYE
jgi:hypothetical protein